MEGREESRRRGYRVVAWFCLFGSALVVFGLAIFLSLALSGQPWRPPAGVWLPVAVLSPVMFWYTGEFVSKWNSFRGATQRLIVRESAAGPIGLELRGERRGELRWRRVATADEARIVIAPIRTPSGRYRSLEWGGVGVAVEMQGEMFFLAACEDAGAAERYASRLPSPLAALAVERDGEIEVCGLWRMRGA